MASRDGGPHAGQPVLAAGPPLADARAAVIALHGRGAGAADILGLSGAFDRPNVTWLAPDAAGGAWYPNPFTAPVTANEPYLSSALGVVGALIAHLEGEGIAAERVVLLGFSQGACLAAEYTARNPRRYGGLVVFSGGLIGERVDPSAYAGSLAATPTFVGCSDVDPFIPLARVSESIAVLRTLGADVTERIYPGAGHTVLADEIAEAQRILDAVLT